MTYATINPATGQTEVTFPALFPGELEDRLARASAAFAAYRTTSLAERAALLQAIATTLEAEVDSIARVITTEMGKTLASAAAEVTKCAAAFRFYARNGEALLADEPADAGAVGAARAFVRYQPMGPVLAVMPWNYPWWQVTRFAAPCLMAGNVGLLKHASNVPQTALAIQDVLARAGVPEGVFQTLLIDAATVEQVLRDPRVRAATVTGSTAAGASVAAICGAEGKPTVLELGGSDPFVVLPSADLDAAVAVGVRGRCQNNGQSCIAAKRFLVHAQVADAFLERFVAAMAAQTVGDPMAPATDIGPLATRQGREVLAEQVADALAGGATLHCGGEVADGSGWYYPPTVLSGITATMRVSTEEVFGPVAQVQVVASLEEAIDLANATSFGLGANIWSRDPAEQERFVRDAEAGMVFVNGTTTSYPGLPFGGVKASGYGRELGAPGLRAFCNAKSVWVAKDPNQL